MKKRIKIIVATCVCAAVLIGLTITACMPVTVQVRFPQLENSVRNPAPANNTLPVNVTNVPETVLSDAQQTEAVPTTEPAAGATADAASVTPDAASAPQTNESQTQQTVQPQPAETTSSNAALTKEEIVSRYNTAVNKVKKETSSLTRNYKHVSAPEDQLELPSAIQGLGKTAIGTFVKGTDTSESWTNKEDMQIVFPVGNTDYSSHLTADMVETATCEEVGGTYKITLKLYDDKLTSPAKGEGYAGVFNTTTASTFTEINIPTITFNRVDINCVNGSITCTVDKATQRVTEITFANTDILKLEVKVVVATLNVKLALAVKENYSISY